MTWLYRYILATDLARYEGEGWEYVGPWMSLGGWEAVIVRREIK